MSRVSKRMARGAKTETGRYRAGIYARLSSDRDIKKNESIEVQIEIAKKFVNEFNGNVCEERIEIAGIYTDLGKTGSNFNREGFQKLIKDIKCGRINCVIVKDLSRFGRNYLEAGNYIENIFPFMGVRFIAVADDFDTAKVNDRMSFEIKNLVNDMYAKDFSGKAVLNLKQRREEGAYVGGVTPYGYHSRYADKKRVLIPDEDTREIVKCIFEKFIETKNFSSVAREMNLMKVNPPAVYRQTKNVYYAGDDKNFKGWSGSTVERIIKSDTYAGNLVQGKTSITGRSEKNRIKKPENEWIVTKDAHEPLIDRELFFRAGEISRECGRKKSAVKKIPLEENIFADVVFCGVCGKKMTRNSQSGYFFENRINCFAHSRIPSERLKEIVRAVLRMEFKIFLKKPVCTEKYISEKRLRKIGKEIRFFYEKETEIYEEYRLGKMDAKEYTDLKKQRKGRLADLEKRRQTWQNELAEFQMCFNGTGKLTKEVIDCFIQKIYIYPGKRVEVEVLFKPDCRKD